MKSGCATTTAMRVRGTMINGKTFSEGNDNGDGSQTNEFRFAFQKLHPTVELSANTFFRSSLLVESIF